jgi:hypothetical protein
MIVEKTASFNAALNAWITKLEDDEKMNMSVPWSCGCG